MVYLALWFYLSVQHHLEHIAKNLCQGVYSLPEVSICVLSDYGLHRDGAHQEEPLYRWISPDHLFQFLDFCLLEIHHTVDFVDGVDGVDGVDTV
jgi:hypothetical protein